MRIEPAALRFDAGTPVSLSYGDVYHSADSGPGQANHVFLDGNGLPGRWAGTRVFSVFETGFGIGLNFLATLEAWRNDPARGERLHYVSVEKHPFARHHLQKLHLRYPEYATSAAQLCEAWPPLVCGLHRLFFENGRVVLTLAFGEAADLVPRLRMRADAIYLDGFAPARNPDMWSPHLMKAIARLSQVGATLATWSTASAVRENLEAAGFALEKRPGFGHKREMLSGRFAPRWPMRERPAASSERRAIVVGAGLAGAAVTERLTARGWHVVVVERNPALPPAPRGVFHPHVSRDDCILSRVARNAFLTASSRWSALERTGHDLHWSRCGVLQLTADFQRHHWSDETVKRLGFPRDYAEYVDRSRAESLAATRLRTGGWWFPEGGWMEPPSLVGALLKRVEPAAIHLGTTVDSIVRQRKEWRALRADGTTIASASVLILANSSDATRLASFAQRLNRVRGQATCIPAERLSAPRTVITGSGYVLPPDDGIVVTGSTYDLDDDPRPQVQGHTANLARLAHMLPGALGEVDDAAHVDGTVGFRSVAPDRLPLIGQVPDVDEAQSRSEALAGVHLHDLPRREGLYCVTGLGSRGLIWSALAGELIASLLEAEPLPLESDLADALDPGRFVLRRLRNGRRLNDC
jgi:tRNA 5-methylaminomethyl-2-thiouridine biosynthesis bifunctional protein